MAAFARSLPGHFATVLALAATTILTLAGLGSMFYETWGQPAPRLLAPAVPGLACLVLCLVALRWPRAGGLLLLAAALVLGAWWLSQQADRAGTPFQLILTLCVMLGPVMLAGGLFLLEARHRRLLRRDRVQPSRSWLARNYRYLLTACVPLAAAAILTAQKLPGLLSRLDDGLRGARVIEGNGVILRWAPQGPGWNGKQEDGGYPSWAMLASWGAGAQSESLCAHLDQAGTTLLEHPTHLWRMPTADEIVRSLTRQGENAGCAWTGPAPNARCTRPPDKETPLWAPDEPPIYYWAAGERDSENALCVNYTGGLNHQPKSWRSPTTGYRCVRPVSRD